MTVALPAILSVFLAIDTPGLPGSGGGTGTSAHAANRLAERCGRSSHVAAEICYQAAAAKSHDRVERAFERNLRAATMVDREFNAFAQAHHIPGSSLAAQLKASQAAWLSYSRSQCALEGGTSFGGSGTDILAAACHYRLDAQRLSELERARELLGRWHTSRRKPKSGF